MPLSVSSPPSSPTPNGADGHIELILGPMFSGKSTELLRRLRRYSIAQRRCMLIKYKGDTRYSEDCVSTHDRVEMSATSSSKLADVERCVEDYDVVGVDEGQFFPDVVEFCESQAAKGKVVIVGGLDGDFQRKPFGRILELIPLAEHVAKLHAVCFNCGHDAPFTRRITDETALEVIGGADKYVASCRGCFRVRVSTPPPMTPEQTLVLQTRKVAISGAAAGAAESQRKLTFDPEFDAGWPMSPVKS